ncbi:tight junction protein ZO-1-like [Limulus polyphemus]|uniref:Tight junction protein ZO-1-like n=1 Tax=Limulus polyphemus TaxID=6850 RepID=A0ABM1T0K6_LIMPO|nr:tight junction protein ZO-1-like [Limulus polyphemus]
MTRQRRNSTEEGRSRGRDISRSRSKDRARSYDRGKDRRKSLDRGSRIYEKPHKLRKSGERVTWEHHWVTINRIPGYGFGIAVSGGRDNPHFATRDPSIIISDVLKAGPAEGRLQVNDRVISANGISLENVDYSTAVQILKDCGNMVNLEIMRRVVLPNTKEDTQTLKITLTKNKKKEDFGIVLGCKIYIKELTKRLPAGKDGSLQEGDILVKINNNNTEQLSVKEAKKLIDSAKEKLHLIVKRESNKNETKINNFQAMENKDSSEINFINVSSTKPQWSNQNLYVQPPTPGDFRTFPLRSEYKNTLASDQPLFTGHGHSRSLYTTDVDSPPPRPPPPQMEEIPGNFRKDHHDEELPSRRSKNVLPDPRLISFQKDGSVGIRFTGGNEAGIFVTAVQPDSPASLKGLQPGDKVLKINNKDMKGITREEAIMFLLNTKDRVDLIVQHRKEEYDEVIATKRGDSFYIRTHFCKEDHENKEMSFQIGEIFHVVDSLFNDVVGSWLCYRLDHNNHEIEKGVIPNSSRAEELAQKKQYQSKKDSSSEGRGSFFKRRSARRSKSLSKDYWEEIMFTDGSPRFPAYERVTLKHPGFIRPVVLFGPLADVARTMLFKDHHDKYGFPQLDSVMDEKLKKERSSGIVRISAIKDIMDKGKHAILDISPISVDRLNYAQFYPIVIFLKIECKQMVKDLQIKLAKSSHKNYKKLYENAVQLEKTWSHLFTETITVTSADSWYKKLLETIKKQQQEFIWVGDSKPESNISDDFLLPSRLNYASSPESDLDLTTDYCPEGEMTIYSTSTDLRSVKPFTNPSIETLDVVKNNSGYSSLQQQHQIIALPREQVNYADTGEMVQNLKQSPDQNETDELMYHRTNVDFYGTNEGYRTRLNEDYPAKDILPEPKPPPEIDRNNKPQMNASMGRRTEYRDSPVVSVDRSKMTSQYGRSPERFTLTTSQNVRALHDLHHFTKDTAHPTARHGNIDLSTHQLHSRINSSEENQPPSPPPKPMHFGSRAPTSSRAIPPNNYQNIPWRQDDPLTDGIRNKNYQDNFYYRKYNNPDQSAYKPPQGIYPHYSDSEHSHTPLPPLRFIREKPVSLLSKREEEKTNIEFDSRGGTYTNCNYSNGLQSYTKAGKTRINEPSSIFMNGSYQNIPFDSYKSETKDQYDSSPPPPPPGFLDLSHTENHGSAFELYKKPDSLSHEQDNFPSSEPSRQLSSGSTDSSHRVVATAHGTFNHIGGTLTSEETGVQIVIPPGALPQGSDQEIYFKVCQDTSMLPPLDKDKGEMLLSPLVMCGPHGLKFNIPVELRLPHCASVNPESWSFALKSSETPNSGQPAEWHNVSLDNMDGVSSSCVKENYVSVLVDHF